jgi:tRNA (cmo5U34)-methyltransferase
MDNATAHPAADYDQNVRLSIPFYETIHREIVDLAKTVIPDPEFWLDTGCGTGHLIHLAWPFFPNTQFILADPSEAMLQQAQHRLQDKAGKRVKFLQPVGSEGLQSQMTGNECQIVTAIQCHHYLRQPQRELAVKACFDILGDGGVFITSENITMSTGHGVEIGLKRWGQWQESVGRSPSTIVSHLERFNTEYFPISIDEHRALLSRTGFRAVELFWFSQMQAAFYGIK